MVRPLPPALSALEIRLGLTVGDLVEPDKGRAEAALADAVALVLAEVTESKAAAWAADAPAVVELVVLTAARRGFENPRGIQQETLGAHTVGLTESTGVYLTARELAQVRRAASGRRLSSFTGSVRTPSAYGLGLVDGTVYVPVVGGSPVPLLSVGDSGLGGS